MAIRTTSSGRRTIYSPFKENMITMVNSKAIKVSGLILGTNFSSYHSRPFAGSRKNLVRKPAVKGMPR